MRRMAKHKPQRLSGLLTAALALLLTAYAFCEPYLLRIDRADREIEGLPAAFDGVKVAFISDIHMGERYSRPRLTKLVDAINAGRPDIVLLGGDYAENAEDFRVCAIELAKLRAPLGIFAVRGNHERYVDAETFAGIMRQNGIIPCETACFTVEKDGEAISIAGIPYLRGQRRENALFKNCELKQTALLLAHDPRDVERAGGSFDLAFAGHTHGGQVTFFGLFGPSTRLLPAYTSHWVNVAGITTLCSNGVGTSGLPVRFMAPPEVHIITLRRSPNPAPR